MKKTLVLTLAVAFIAVLSAFTLSPHHESMQQSTTSSVFYKDINGNWQSYLEGDECPEGTQVICERPDPDNPTRIVNLYKSMTEGDFLKYNP